jgi:hypothetical protein
MFAALVRALWRRMRRERAPHDGRNLNFLNFGGLIGLNIGRCQSDATITMARTTASRFGRSTSASINSKSASCVERIAVLS